MPANQGNQGTGRSQSGRQVGDQTSARLWLKGHSKRPILCDLQRQHLRLGSDRSNG